MSAWLFTWNPKHYAWDEPLEGWKNMMSEIEQIGFSLQRWSCGGTRSIKPGDRIFLIRLGKNNPGIVAGGTAVSAVFSGPHWDPEQAKSGKTANRVFVQFDRIINPEGGTVLSKAFLREHFPQMCWTPQSSGISIAADILPALEQAWAAITR